MRLVISAALLFGALALAQVPGKVGYQGLLLKSDGKPETGAKLMTFTIHGQETGGTGLWTETQVVALTQGYYATYLGETNPVDASAFGGGDRFLELAVDGETLTPRMRLGSVPYALIAERATAVSGGTVDATAISVGGNLVIDSAGALAGSARYSAGPGIALDGGAISVRACQPGEILRWSGSPAATWACSTTGAASYGAAANGGLVLAGSSGTDFSLLTSCASGELLKWNGSAWECGSAGTGTVTSIDTGSGLSGGPITTSGTIGIAGGGVTNSMLANSSLTAGAGTGLTGGGLVALGGATTLELATPVAIAHGGTGLSAGPSLANEFLRSDGAGAWTTGVIGTADLPSLSGSYVALTSDQTIGGAKTFSSEIVGSISGNAGTASALEANGANCSAGNAPLGVSAAGAVEGCFDVATQAELDAHASDSSAHGATASNTANSIVLRNSGGGFSAGTITATLSGNASTVTNGVYSNLSYANPTWITQLAATKLTGAVGVSNGGTGATSAPAALTNLGAAAATHTHTPVVGKWHFESATPQPSQLDIPWSSEDFNTSPATFGFTAGSPTLMINVAGYYQICATIHFQPNNSGNPWDFGIYQRAYTAVLLYAGKDGLSPSQTGHGYSYCTNANIAAGTNVYIRTTGTNKVYGTIGDRYTSMTIAKL